MGSISAEPKLRRTGREGKKWERKTTPSRAETRSGGRGRRPLGLGGARPTRTGVDRKKHKTTTGERKEGARAWAY